MILGVGYKKRSGKDTFAHEFRKLALYDYVRSTSADEWKVGGTPLVQIKHFAEPVKTLATSIVGERDKLEFLPTWDMTYRELLILIGEGMREKRPDFWLKALLDRYDGKPWIVADMRYPNEAEAIKSLGGKLIKVERSLEDDDRASENALNDWTDWDFVIDNNGSLNEYKRKIRTLYYNYRPWF